MSVCEVTALIVAYILGSIPFGIVFTRLAGYEDIRKKGSGNIGATNVLRNTNKLLGALTLICDVGKGALAVFLVQHFCKSHNLAIYAGAAAIIGHIFPIWLKFKGGKGVATSLAVFVVLDWRIGLFAVAAWALGFILTKISGAASLTSFIATPIAAQFLTDDVRIKYLVILISILVVIKHHTNIKQLINR